MNRYDVIRLVADNPAAHGVFDAVTLINRDVFCEVKSVGMKETYTAMSQGLSPSIVFVLALAEDYKNERKVIWQSTEYRIIRTFVNGDGIELTCEKVTGDV